MTRKKLGVLVVSGGGFQGLTVVKGLRMSSDIHIVLADCYKENITKYFADRVYITPKIIESGFIEELLRICEREGINLIIPSTDLEIKTLSENKGIFAERGIQVAVSAQDILEIMSDKQKLYSFLQANNHPVLPLLDITDVSLQFPILGKPLTGWGGRDILIFHSREELERYKIEYLKQNFVFQPLLRSFQEYSIDFAIHPKGAVSPLVIRERTKTSGSFAVIGERIFDEIIETLVRNFISTIVPLGAKGIFNVQIMKEGGCYYISDVNPRIGTSAVYANKVGVNLPLFLCADQEGEALSDKVAESNIVNVRMIRYLDEIWVEKQNPELVRAFVFDLDDTLISQKKWIYAKLELLYGQYAKHLPERQIFLATALRVLEEGNRSYMFDEVCDLFCISPDLKSELITVYRSLRPERFSLYSDAEAVMQQLKEKGYKLAILTDNPPDSQKQKIEACGLEQVVDKIVYSRALNKEKPLKECFEEMARQLSLEPHQLVMVGDNLYRDVVGALDAGYQSGYWITRSGTFFNFEETLFREVYGSTYNVHRIDSLYHLIWSFTDF